MWWEIQQHIQDNVAAYAAGAAILLPLVILGRKYIVSYLWWPGEFLAYVAGFHFLVKAIIFTAAWFKVNTRMHWEDRVPPNWNTPLYQIWDMKAFSPQWLFYFEISVFVLILFFMIRYRPMVTQKAGPARQPIRKGRAANVRPPQATRAHPRGR